MKKTSLFGIALASIVTFGSFYTPRPEMISVPFNSERVVYIAKHEHIRDIFRLPFEEAHRVAEKKGISIVDELKKSKPYLGGLESEILGTVTRLNPLDGLYLTKYKFLEQAEMQDVENLAFELYKKVSPIDRFFNITEISFIPDSNLKGVYRPEDISGGYTRHGITTTHPGPYYNRFSNIYLFRRNFLMTARGLAHEMGHCISKNNELCAVAMENYFADYVLDKIPNLKEHMPMETFSYESEDAYNANILFKGLRKKGFNPREIFSISAIHSTDEIKEYLGN